LNNHLTFVQTVAFPCKNFLYAPARARPHMCFVHFNGPIDLVSTIVTTGQQEKESQSYRCAQQSFAAANRPRYTAAEAIFANE
jgi:hypothetical protein